MKTKSEQAEKKTQELEIRERRKRRRKKKGRRDNDSICKDPMSRSVYGIKN